MFHVSQQISSEPSIFSSIVDFPCLLPLTQCPLYFSQAATNTPSLSLSDVSNSPFMILPVQMDLFLKTTLPSPVSIYCKVLALQNYPCPVYYWMSPSANLTLISLISLTHLMEKRNFLFRSKACPSTKISLLHFPCTISFTVYSSALLYIYSTRYISPSSFARLPDNLPTKQPPWQTIRPLLGSSLCLTISRASPIGSIGAFYWVVVADFCWKSILQWESCNYWVGLLDLSMMYLFISFSSTQLMEIVVLLMALSRTRVRN